MDLLLLITFYVLDYFKSKQTLKFITRLGLIFLIDNGTGNPDLIFHVPSKQSLVINQGGKNCNYINTCGKT